MEQKSDNYEIELNGSLTNRELKNHTHPDWYRRGADTERDSPTPAWVKVEEGYLRSKESQTHFRPPIPPFQCQEGKFP